MWSTSIISTLILLRWMICVASSSDNSNASERHRRRYSQSYKTLEKFHTSQTSTVKGLSASIERSLLRTSTSYKGDTADVKRYSKKLAKKGLTPSSSPNGSQKSKKKKGSCPKKTKNSKSKKSKKQQKSKRADHDDDCMTSYDCKNLTTRERDITSVAQSISGNIDLGSTQELALQWLVNNDTITNTCNGPNAIQQRYSLAVFYYSTIGSNWTNDTFWLGPQYECTWYGVECTNGLVTSLFMDENNLQGTLPTEIAALSYLSGLHVYHNSIGGQLPTELGTLTGLNFVDLEVNHFEGNLFFEQLLNVNRTLQYLRGSDNQFIGSIPSWIGVFTRLHEFWAADNHLSGTIPSEIGRLTNLESWYIYDNGLNGTIPWTIGSLSNLELMDLSSNNFIGSIPKSIGKLKKLQRLVMTKDHLTGSIPSSIGNITGLLELFLSNNKLTGSLPTSVTGLKNLSYLLVNENLLTGSLTDFTSPTIFYIDISNNVLGGTISSSFFQKPVLTKFYLSNNTFTGTIPSSFAESTSLQVIWLDGNKLNGTIPEVPVPNGWPQMIEVLLDHNLLTGSVPSSICDLRALNPTRFTTLHADCEPRSLVLGQAQNNCRNGCCTECFLGSLI